MRRKALGVTILIPFLAACVAPSSGVERANATVTKPYPLPRSVRAPSRYKPRQPQVQSLPGIEGVIGATPAELTRQFGPARLDVWEGDARKLQFSNNTCVLDIYLYPTEQSREPQATYVDARKASDGQDVDRAGCIAAIRRAKP